MLAAVAVVLLMSACAIDEGQVATVRPGLPVPEILGNVGTDERPTTGDTARDSEENDQGDDETSGRSGFEFEVGFSFDSDESDASETSDTSAEPEAGDVGDAPADSSVRDEVFERAALDRVNGLVPADIDLTFEWQTIALERDESHQVHALVPVGVDGFPDWPGTKSYSLNDAMGFFTSLRLDAGCDGFCEPKDWETVLNESFMSPFALNDGDVVLLDEPLVAPTGRVLVVDPEGTAIDDVEVVVVRWSNSASRFFECSAGLDNDDRDLWPLFVEVCRVADPGWLTQ